jgi:formamidopyrimidine-DNA glycosylase
MPELPDVEIERRAVERGALGRRIAALERFDPWVSRPHSRRDLATALEGRTLTAAGRRGKTMWVETGGGPLLGLHLGMTGRIAIDEPPDERGWDRFAVTFDDGGRMALNDFRRLGRAVLEPNLDALGPDAAEVGREEFRSLVGRGRSPVKARLMDQSVVAGVGNLLADEALFRARVAPTRPAGELDEDELDAIRREVRAANREAIRGGSLAVGKFVRYRERGRACPRCGAELRVAQVGGRTTYWCPREQV